MRDLALAMFIGFVVVLIYTVLVATGLFTPLAIILGLGFSIKHALAYRQKQKDNKFFENIERFRRGIH